MKELTIEQKAQRYDEILARVNGVNIPYYKEDIMSKVKEFVDYLLPELVESEDESDERIRKDIVFYIAAHHKDDGEKARWLYWLEKQGKSKSYSWKPSKEQFEALDYAYNSCSDTERGNYYEGVLETLIEDLHRLENQGEQKPSVIIPKFRVGDEIKTSNEESLTITKIDEKGYWSEDLFVCSFEDSAKWELVGKLVDKAEPKFHKGDWIVHHGTENIYQVVAVIGNQYQLKYGDNYTVQSCADVDRCARLWDITKDAKDGDVLCTYECDEPKIVFILKGTPKKHYALSYHCYYNIMYPHFGSDSEKGCLAPNDEDVKPATKEQRDQLEKAMADAGYTFDFEKKELKKIEEEFNGEDYGIDSLWHAQNILERTLGCVEGYQSDDGILEHKCAITAVKKLYGQKSAWSEEDEIMHKTIILNLKVQMENCAVPSKDSLNKAIGWFQKLKHQRTFVPSEEEMKALEFCLEHNIDKDGVFGSKVVKLYKKLKKLTK